MGVIYSVLIVDDELHGRENLSILLRENCPQVNVVSVASSAFEARVKIQSLKPDLVFLDIGLDIVSGIDLVKSFSEPDFKTIFVTAYKEYAREALSLGAAGYILKPILTEELISVVNGACELITKKREPQKAAAVSHTTKYNPSLIINHSNGYFVINTNDIMYLEANGSYCKIHCIDEKSITTSITLKKLATRLNPDAFARIHKTFLVNMAYVKEYKNTGDGSVLLKNGATLKVAVLKRAEFKQRLKNYMGLYD